MNYEKLDQIVDSLKDELVRDIQRWVSVPSVQGEACENAPFGKEVRRALDMALADAKKYGFEVRDIDGYAGDVSLGSGEQTMGMLCHLDVVPAGDGWQHDPWGGEIEDGKIFGRGTTDDKGPALCALYAMRAVKEAGIPLKDGVRLILGCDEETGMSDMHYYASKHKMPDYGFSPDAEFPVINIEKGGLNMVLSKVTGGEDGAEMPVYSLYAGERPNVVPAVAKAVVGLGKSTIEALNEKLKAIESENENFHLEATALEGGKAEIIAHGKNAHAAMAELGINAAGMLLIALKALNAGGGSREAIAMLADVIGMEYDGKSLGIFCEDELSGKLTCNLGILRYDGVNISALLDIRFPICGDQATMLGQAAMTVSPAGMAVTRESGRQPHHIPAEHKIVRGLLKVYHDVTGNEAYTIAIGGGTYSRMMPNTVAFGPGLPGDMDLCHMPDEYIHIDNMMIGVKVFAHAIAELAGGLIED